MNQHCVKRPSFKKGFKLNNPPIVTLRSKGYWKYDYRHYRFLHCVLTSICNYRDFHYVQLKRNGIYWSNKHWILGLAR